MSPSGFTNYGTSLALDSRGIPHVAYVLREAYELKYAVRGASGWDIEVVKPNRTGAFVSLKLDRLDRPHIAFYDGYDYDLLYAANVSGTWRIETVDSGRPDWNCGLYASLALDSQGRPRIAYTCETRVTPLERRLKYAAWNGTGWAIDLLGTNMSDPSLAMDSQDRPHLSYFNASGLQLKHAYNDGLRWNIEIADTGANLSSKGTSITVDSLGGVHIGYFDADAWTLKYARRNESGWTVEVVDRLLIKGCQGWRDVSLALDSSENPAMAYFACKPSLPGHFEYAWRNSTGWSTEVVYSEWGSGGWPSLAFDRRANPHVSFLDGAVGKVMYATVPPSAPDYVPENAGLPGPIIVAPSRPVTLSVNVTNLGAPWNVSSTLAFYNASTPSVPFARFPVPPLWAIETSGPYVVNWTSPAPGTYAVVAFVDYEGVVPELDETNNVYTWTIDVVPPPLPDLAVLDVDVTATPNTVFIGETVSFSATIRNLGNASADALAALFVDANGNGFPDLGEAFDAPPVSLAPGANESFVRSWIPTAEGTVPLCAYADPDDTLAEADEGNNAGCATVIVVAPETRPDYVPTMPLPLPSVRVGLSMPLTFSLAVRNEGNGTANATATLAFRNESMPPFASFPVPPLAPGEASVRFEAPWMSPATPGTYRVVAEADAADDLLEWNETNNAYTWTIDVVPGPITTLVVGQPNVTGTEIYVTSATPLSLSVLDQSGTGINRTAYRVDAGPWRDYASPFLLAGEGEHFLEWFSEDNAGNVEATRNTTLRVDDTPPSTSLSIGDPKYLVAATFVTSRTPLSLEATDGGVTPVGFARVEYRLDDGTWTTYATPFTAAGEGAHSLEFRATDLLLNSEPFKQETFVVDDTPPATIADVGTPRYASDRTYLTSATPIVLTSADGGAIPVGVASLEYRVDGGTWTAYAAPFTVTGTDGPRTIEYRGVDRLGNREAVLTLVVVLDETPPSTDIAPGAGPSTPETRFSLTATDAGCGVARTEYRVDGGPWIPYAAPFAIPVGEHVIGYRSVDYLGNREAERTLPVTVGGTTVLPAELNWKPLVAAVFTLILALAGAWASRRAPWSGVRGRRGALKAFAFTALPFILLEAATGVVSHFMGLLSIPPVLGVGTAVDSAILGMGLAVAVYRGLRTRSRNLEASDNGASHGTNM